MRSWPAFEGEAPIEGFSIIARATIYFTLYDAEGTVIDWGDGTTQTIGPEGSPSVRVGKTWTADIYTPHTVTITPTFSNIDLKQAAGLLAILTPFPSTMSWITDCEDILGGCGLLEYVHPALFSNMPNVTSFAKAFNNTTSLVTVPETLFQYTPLVTTFEQCFFRSAIEQPPNNLFSGNPLATNFQECFRRSSVKSLPGGLFSRNVNATNFYECFYECTELETIGNGLFYYNLNALDFFMCFSGCTALTNVGTNMFQGSQESVRFRAFMMGCSSITSAVPALWNLFPNAQSTALAFQGCTNAANYNQIPNDWK